MKNFMKTAVAAVCVVAAGMGGFKAYNAANQSQADLLLAENVEALSDPDGSTNNTLKSGDWHSNFVLDTVWYVSGGSATATLTSAPSWWASLSTNYSTMKCCINSVDENACNFSGEDPKCKQYVIRSSR